MSRPNGRQSRWMSLPLAMRVVLQGLMVAIGGAVYRFVTPRFDESRAPWDTELVVLMAAVGALGAYLYDRRIRHQQRAAESEDARSQ